MIKGWKIQLCKIIAFPAWILIAVSCLLMALVSCCSWLFIVGPRKIFGGAVSAASPALAQRKVDSTKPNTIDQHDEPLNAA
ncbi:hypothetical protein P378_10260 [Desulforamulus profundi]|uniref:Uncharacterized protein n=1 Tax=Desulforamulus profundi TaxID=1383067 RepID=A0A2C6MEX5_9FIRM|nr:hypothetical protein [Desulforamulus profundi]PHJ38205.1 hypothetical protein P378_10260 [Desulforamulus profundi]